MTKVDGKQYGRRQRLSAKLGRYEAQLLRALHRRGVQGCIPARLLDPRRVGAPPARGIDIEPQSDIALHATSIEDSWITEGQIGVEHLGHFIGVRRLSLEGLRHFLRGVLLHAAARGRHGKHRTPNELRHARNIPGMSLHDFACSVSSAMSCNAASGVSVFTSIARNRSTAT